MNGGQDLGHSGLAHSEHMTRSAALDMKPHFPGSILGSLLLSRCVFFRASAFGLHSTLCPLPV